MARTGIVPGTVCTACAADSWRRLCRYHGGSGCAFCLGRGFRVWDGAWTRCDHLPAVQAQVYVDQVPED